MRFTTYSMHAVLQYLLEHIHSKATRRNH
jgi:hypothetical protein